MKVSYIGACVLTLIIDAAYARAELVRGPAVGAEGSAASILGTPGQYVALGYAFELHLGYEFLSGVAPFGALDYSHWNTNFGTEWQLAAQVGVRWSFEWRRVVPWVEGAAGFGQRVYGPSEAADGGFLTIGGVGLDVPVTRRVRTGLHLRLNHQGDGVNGSTTWLNFGIGATLFAF